MHRFTLTLSHSFRSAISTLCAGVCILSVVGCAATHDERMSYSAPAEYEDEAFDAASKRPPMPETVYRTARLLAARGMTDAAYSTLKNLIEEHPTYAPAYVELAAIQVRQRRVGAAINTLEAGIEHVPDDHVLHNDLGMCLMLTGNYERALESFSTAASLNPENARYRSNKALALGMLGQYDDALAIYHEVETPANAHYNLAIVCEARADYDRAEREFKRAYELNPSLEHAPKAN